MKETIQANLYAKERPKIYIKDQQLLQCAVVKENNKMWEFQFW